MRVRNETESTFDPGGNLSPLMFYGDDAPGTDNRFLRAPLMSLYWDVTNSVLYVKTANNRAAADWVKSITTENLSSHSGGNARGTAAVDLQTMRTADTQVASGIAAAIGGGSHNTASGGSATIGGGVGNTASGSYAAVGGGIYNTASGFGAVVPGGYYGVASKRGQLAHASGSFAVAGDAQRSVYVAHNITTDATPAVLYLDFDGDYLLTIADDTVWNFRAEIVAMTADAAKYAAYTVVGLIKRANGTVAVAGVATTTINESDGGWDATAEADDTNKALSIKVTGAAGTTIRWVAAVYTTEVTFASA